MGLESWMPTAALKPCRYRGCGNLAFAGFCHEHGYDRRRPDANHRGYGAAWRKIRTEVLMDAPWCECGKPATEVDHIISRRRGGTDERSNLQALCHACHARKTIQVDGRWG